MLNYLQRGPDIVDAAKIEMKERLQGRSYTSLISGSVTPSAMINREIMDTRGTNSVSGSSIGGRSVLIMCARRIVAFKRQLTCSSIAILQT
jgi:hypothetical protein